MYVPVDSHVSLNNYFDSKNIYCFISLSNFTKNKEAFGRKIPIQLRVLQGNAGNESMILPFRIRELSPFPRMSPNSSFYTGSTGSFI